MAGTPEFLSVLRRVGLSLSNGNFPSLNFKPFKVECFESILKGQDVIGVLPTGSGMSMLLHTGLYRSRHEQLTPPPKLGKSALGTSLVKSKVFFIQFKKWDC